MPPDVAEDGVRGLGQVSPQCDLVAHCAGHDEQGGFVAGKRGHGGFEVVGCRVLEEDVVQKRGVDDGIEHRGRGSGHHIAPEVIGRRAGLLPGVDLLVGGGGAVYRFHGGSHGSATAAAVDGGSCAISICLTDCARRRSPFPCFDSTAYPVSQRERKHRHARKLME